MPLSWLAGGACLMIAVMAGVSDRARRLRDDPDRVGVVDWRSVQLFALMAAMICAGIAFKA